MILCMSHAKMKHLKWFWLLVVLNSIKDCTAVEADFTVSVEPGRRECFHQYVPTGSSFEVEYQVIEGGDLDVDFFVISQSGQVVLSETRKSDGVHRIDTNESGDYKICFDNTFSRFSNKLIFFEMITNDPDPNWEKLNVIEEIDYIEDQTDYEFKLDTFKQGLENIKINLDKSRHTQNLLRVHETRDRALQEHNFERVNFWSGVQLFIMISVGLMQVLMIRSLFTDNTESKGFKMST